MKRHNELAKCGPACMLRTKHTDLNLSITECKDLLRCLLRSNPSERIRMEDIMAHPWMNKGHSLPFGPAPFPNKLKLADISDDIVDHMVHTLNVGCL